MGVILYELCALKPPFDAPSLHILAMKIARGAFNPLSRTYSNELKALVGKMLHVDPSKRPSIQAILNERIIQSRIKSFLTETVYNHEFSHTILHKEHVFEKKSLLDGGLQREDVQKLSNPIPSYGGN